MNMFLYFLYCLLVFFGVLYAFNCFSMKTTYRCDDLRSKYLAIKEDFSYYERDLYRLLDEGLSNLVTVRIENMSVRLLDISRKAMYESISLYDEIGELYHKIGNLRMFLHEYRLS